MRYEEYYLAVQRVLVLVMLAAAALSAVLPAAKPAPDGEPLLAPVMAQPVAAAREGDFGNLEVVSGQGLSLSQALVLVNGVKQGDLAAGRLSLRVCPGDVVELDLNAYQRLLSFQVIPVSANIDPDYLRLSVSGSSGVLSLGIIVFR